MFDFKASCFCYPMFFLSLQSTPPLRQRLLYQGNLLRVPKNTLSDYSKPRSETGVQLLGVVAFESILGVYFSAI